MIFSLSIDGGCTTSDTQKQKKLSALAAEKKPLHLYLSHAMKINFMCTFFMLRHMAQQRAAVLRLG